ncbi:MAG: DUF4476 domain-containing protein [Ignavibacteria bacterium]
MKNFFFLIFLVFFLFNNSSSKSGDVTSSLNLSLYDGGNFTAVFNNGESTPVTDEIEYNNIEAGKYFLKVIKESPKVPAVPDVIFSDYIIIPQDCKVFAVIDESNHLYIYKKISDYANYTGTHHSCDCNCEFCRKCIYKKGNIGETEHYNDDCYSKSMNDKDFSDALKIISDKSFEATKVDIGKQVIDANTISCGQLREMLKTLSFEDGKIQLAEYAYDKICDPKNFMKVYDAFSFESSVQMLQQFVSQKK